MNRWSEDLQELKNKRIKLLGDCLVCGAFLAYVGAFTWEFRHELVFETWEKDLIEKSVPLSQPFKLEDLLTSDVEISKYEFRQFNSYFKLSNKNYQLHLNL